MPFEAREAAAILTCTEPDDCEIQDAATFETVGGSEGAVVHSLESGLYSIVATVYVSTLVNKDATLTCRLVSNLGDTDAKVIASVQESFSANETRPISLTAAVQWPLDANEVRLQCTSNRQLAAAPSATEYVLIAIPLKLPMESMN